MHTCVFCGSYAFSAVRIGGALVFACPSHQNKRRLPPALRAKVGRHGHDVPRSREG